MNGCARTESIKEQMFIKYKSIFAENLNYSSPDGGKEPASIWGKWDRIESISVL